MTGLTLEEKQSIHDLQIQQILQRLDLLTELLRGIYQKLQLVEGDA